MKEKIKKIKILFKHFVYIDFSAWKEYVWDADLDDYICCSGQMCSCGGQTVGENYN